MSEIIQVDIANKKIISFSNDKVPAFVEQKHKEWVKYGEENNYPQYLVTLFNRSAKHNAILTSKQLYISGQGWEFDPIGMEGKDIVSLKGFIDTPNPFDTLEEICKKTTLDCELFGGTYIRVVSTRGKSGIAEIYHEDYCSWRSNEDNTEFYYSRKWLNPQGGENLNVKPEKTLPAYDPNKVQKESIYYYKSYRPNTDTYTLPEYIGAVPAIITDAEIANYHRAEIQNSFKGSKMVVFKDGKPSDEEGKMTEKKIRSKFAPTDAAGGIVLVFVDDPTRVPEVVDLTAGDFADKYNALNEAIQQEIFVGHKITSPMLFGVRVEGQLGGRNEMVDSYNLFQNTYVTPKQRVQEYIYNLFAPIKGKLKIKKLEPIMPSFSEQTLMTILDRNEMREIIGRKPAAQPVQMSCEKFNSAGNDEQDIAVFLKYGTPADQFIQVKRKKFMFGTHDFALSNIEQAIVDLVKKTPDITKSDIQKVLKIDKTSLEDSLETLIADELIVLKGDTVTITNKGTNQEVKTFPELYIRYRYALRPDAPALLPGGESRDFCKAMMDNPRYFTRQEIELIGDELGALYSIPNYDAFRRRGGWYHDPQKDANLPFCRHIWQQELVKKIK